MQLSIFSRRSVAAACLQRWMATLVVAEYGSKGLTKSTLSSVTAAKGLGSPIHLLVSGHGVSEIAKAASKLPDVEKVLVADSECLKHHLPEPLAALLSSLIKKQGHTACVMPASTFGKNVLPRAAALLDAQPITDVIKIEGGGVFQRPIYAGKAIATVKYSGSAPCMLTVRSTSFQPNGAGPASRSAGVEPVPQEHISAAEEALAQAPVQWVSEQVKASDRPDLGSARVVVSGGRALKSAEHFRLLERLADLLGGAVGASRAAVDMGMAPNELQVGQTGKVVAPDLYIAVGISGAIQHMAGMKDSKVVVAINTDPEAPIFQSADYGLVQDLFKALPDLVEAVERAKA